MKKKLNTEKFSLYQLRDKQHLYVAIPNEYKHAIDYELSQYGSYHDVPVDKTVRGIFLDIQNNELVLDETRQQNDITINRLIPL